MLQRMNRDLSPDSIIFTASADRSSFASSDADASPHLAGLDISSGPDSYTYKPKLYRSSTYLNKKSENVQAQKDDHYLKEGNEPKEGGDSARSSFSQALKDCQVRRSRSAALYRKQDRQRPASLDLNSHHLNAVTSPRFGVMNKGSITTPRTGTVLSPGTPNYGHNGGTTQKGWSSERVPLRNNANRRNINTSLFPLSNGRTLPSKWEDAERWIISPNAGDGALKNSVQQPQRRPKAKSGPLGPPGFAYNNSLQSPAIPLEGGCVGSLVGGSYFPVRASLGSSGAAGIYGARADPYMARSVSLHGCTEMINQSTHPGHQDYIVDSDKDASTDISRVVSRRDMATQMSPEGSSRSSSISRLSFSLITPSALPIMELDCTQSSRSDVRDVQIDERVPVTSWSKKNRAQFPGKVLGNSNDWRSKAVDIRSSDREVSEAAKSISKLRREEAKISAWENRQKAKAEAAIEKLEMKLEKKRSSSMDKIMNKLKSAQKKAQEMRSWMSTDQSRKVSKTSYKVKSFRHTHQITSLGGCFTCRAF